MGKINVTVGFFVDADGNYMAQCDKSHGVEMEWIEVPYPPLDSRQKWDGYDYGPIPLTPEDFKTAVQEFLNRQAQQYGYDSLAVAISYADEPAVPKFQQEGQAFRAWRSLVWDYCYTQLDLVEAGERETPSVDQLLSELPILVI